LKTANLAIVFTDIKGFTERTSRQTLEQNQRLLKTHSDLLVPVFKAFGGRIIKSIGDAFLVTFESPTQAVLAGMALQDRLWQYNRGVLDVERLDVRVAINAGEVRLESNDVFGEPVNIASRVEALAEPGQVFFTEAVYLAMNKAEVPSQEVGAFELKGIPGKIRVFRVPLAPYRVEPPPSLVHLTPGGAEPALEQDQPPFGNLALSRVPESALTQGPGLASTAARLARGTRSLFSAGGRPGLVWAVGGVALALLLLGGGWVLLRGGGRAESAVEAVAKAPPKERLGLADTAHRLIDEEKSSPGQKALLHGRVDEVMEAYPQAVRNYRTAVSAGNDEAGERLIALLKHPECRVRSLAADALGDLRVAGAREPLEDLARKGGPGEDSLLAPITCSSRKVAQKALERLAR
jgi:adenylate cyclase